MGLEIKSSRVISSMTSLIYNKEPEITPEDLISRPMFYCDSESASKNLSNNISYDIIWTEKISKSYSDVTGSQKPEIRSWDEFRFDDNRN